MNGKLISELPFLDLGDESRVQDIREKFFGTLDNTRPLTETEVTVPVPFGNGNETKIYVSWIIKCFFKTITAWNY